MLTRMMVRGVLALGLFVCFGNVLMESVQAVPPPRFREFKIVNNTGREVRDVTVKLTLSDPNNRASLMPNPIVFTISSMPADQTFILNTGSSNAALDGVAKILVDGQCPAGTSLAGLCFIDAKRHDYDPGNAGDEYAGFTPAAPAGGQDYYATVEFRRRSGGGFEAHLHGKWRWGTDWPANPVEVVARFQ